MATLNPYLTFSGNCNEAMNYYKEVLGGELSMIIAGESPIAAQMPAKYHSSVLHSSLKSGDFEIMATDMIPGSFVEGNTVHLCLLCKNENEIHSLFEKLSTGGKVDQPIHEMFFGLIGTVTDKFGKHWLLEMDKSQS
jgi:PhnB protein